MSAIDTLRIRPFIPEDARLEGGIPHGPTVGLTGIIDEAVVGYGGLYQLGQRHWGFFYLPEDGPAGLLRRERPRLLHRLALGVLEAADRIGIGEVFSPCDTSFARAERWMTALGFRPLLETEKPADVAAIEAAIGRGSTWIRHV